MTSVLRPVSSARSSRLCSLPTAGRTAGHAHAAPTTLQCDAPSCPRLHRRCFAQVKDIDGPPTLYCDAWFTPSSPRAMPPPPPLPSPTPHQSSLDDYRPQQDHQPPDERTLQIGRTVRTLHDRLPTLLLSPLPSHILSPRISLHLFPSTHPHLPTVRGRLAYIAALWTAPVAWGRVPLVGNVQLSILSERMVGHGGTAVATSSSLAPPRHEKLIVKWKTCGAAGGMSRGVALAARDPVDKLRHLVAGGTPSRQDQPLARDDARPPEEFTGIFIFEFDDCGRVARHTIEHTDEGGFSDRTARVVGVTDWLLARFHARGGPKTGALPGLAWCGGVAPLRRDQDERGPGGGRG